MERRKGKGAKEEKKERNREEREKDEENRGRGEKTEKNSYLISLHAITSAFSPRPSKDSF